MFDRRTVRRLRVFKPVPLLALTVSLAMAAAQASSAPPARAEAIDPAYDVLRAGAYAVGPALDSAATGPRGAIAPSGELVMATIDPALEGMMVRRPASTHSGRLRLTNLDAGRSVTAGIIVDFSLRTPVALSPEAARRLGLADMRGVHSILIERDGPR